VKTAIFLEFLALKFNPEQYSPFPFTFLSNTVMYSWRVMFKYYKNITISFCHKKSIMHQQDTINEEDKIIRNKYLLNNKKRDLKFPPCYC